jgi:hypothetical protein
LDEDQVTNSKRSPEFQRAFVTAQYCFGVRGDELGAPLRPIGLTTAAAQLAGALRQDERQRRAAALASELARLSAAVDAGRLLP